MCAPNFCFDFPPSASASGPCRPLTVASAIYERLDVLDLFLALPAAAQGLQQRLAALPDADRLLPKAAAAVRALLQQQQSVLNAQQQQQQLDAAGAWLAAAVRLPSRQPWHASHIARSKRSREAAVCLNTASMAHVN